MPTYDYQCQNCGHRFELFQRMSDDPVTTCPTCEGPVERLITGGTGLIFKGSGFYITDYKSNGNGKSADKKDTGSNGESKSSDSSSAKSTD